MSRYTLQSSPFRQNVRPVIWLDVEKRTADPEPALTSVLWEDGLKTYAHDAILAASAKARGLEFLPWLELAVKVVRVAQATDSLIAGYSIPERDLLMKACPEQAEWIKANYLNANAAKWFKNHRPKLYAEACRTAGERRSPGLKDFLIQPAVGYPYKKYLLAVQPARSWAAFGRSSPSVVVSTANSPTKPAGIGPTSSNTTAKTSWACSTW